MRKKSYKMYMYKSLNSSEPSTFASNSVLFPEILLAQKILGGNILLDVMWPQSS